MADLTDLFSASSPSPPRPARSPTPVTREEALFLSPSDTPDRPVYQSQRVPSPPRQPVFRRQEVNVYDGDGGIRPDEGVSNGNGLREAGPAGGYMAYDPLDLSAAFEEGERAQEGEEPQGKKRRVMAKVDIERLMGDHGFPALMKSAKRFKPRGKGNEHKDLRDLLTVYQLWAHGMFPKGDFEGTIKRVETICRTRRMEIAMKGYRDAFYPPPTSPSPPLSPARSSGGPSQLPHSETPRAQGNGLRATEDNELDDEDIRGGHQSSEPLFDLAGDDDGPDFDELLAMEEMEQQRAGSEERRQEARAARLKAFGGGATGDGGEGKSREIGDDAPPPLGEEDEWEGLYD